MVDWTKQEPKARVIAAYTSLGIPVAIALATVTVNWNAQVQSAAEACRDKTLKFYDDASAAADRLQQQGVAPSLKADITNRQAIALDLLTQSCKRGNVDIPLGVKSVIDRLYRLAPENGARASLANSAERADASASNGGSVSASQPTAQPAQAAGTIRLFLQISSEAQRPAAQLLATAIRSQQLAGHPIDVPGIELVAPQPSSSLRCLKRADCRQAGALASIVRQTLPNITLQLTDLSARYEQEAGVKPGTYELWIGEGADLSIAEASR